MNVRARISVVLLASLATLVPTAVVLAAGPASATDGNAHISPELLGVAVDGTTSARAQATYDDVLFRRDAATHARVTAETELVALAERDAALTAAIAEQTDLRKAAAVRLVAARREVQQIAVGEYVQSATYDDLTRAMDVGSSVRIGGAQELGSAVQEDRARIQAEAADEVAAASAALDDAQDERDDARARVVVVTTERERAAAEEAALTEEVARRLVELEIARATSRVTGADFTLVALDAYWRAAASQPSCGVAWWALAGVSRVEGRHGTFGGATLRADGQVSRPIIGIPLDGANATLLIGDTDGGAIDGDPVFDRAVGPMQFIPSTWDRWSRDGNGDGVRDPQNIYDATAAAAAYLCSGRRLVDDAGLRAGYFSYNRSDAYVARVLSFAHSYATLAIPPSPQ
jgi:membrane-bound lytic murein transglycosylase B